MSDGATTGMDPRFDPRFQRGYSGEIASEADVAATRRPAVERVPDPPRDAPDAVMAERVGSPRAVGVGPRSTGGTSAAGTAGSPVAAGSRGAAGSPGSRGSASRPDVDALLAPLGDGATFGIPDGPSAPTARAWLIAGWTVTLAAAVLGVWWSWSVHSDIGYYTGGVAPGDQAFRELGWTLAPSLLLAGASGATVLTAFAALLQLRTVQYDAVAPATGAADAEAAEAEATAPRDRRGAASWALLGILAANVLGLIWLASRMIAGATSNAGLVIDGDGNATSDGSAQLAAMAFSQFAGSVIGPLATCAIVAFVALVVVETRRATLSAARERSARPGRP